MAHDRLDSYLRALAAAGGSDLHIKVGSPARMRVDGVLRRIPGEETLLPEDTAGMADGIMRADVRARFADSADVDFAYSISDVGRFRVNAFRQRGSVAMIFRLV